MLYKLQNKFTVRSVYIFFLPCKVEVAVLYILEKERGGV